MCIRDSHGGVGGSVAGDEGEARDAAEGDGAVGPEKGYAHGGGAGVDVGNGDGVCAAAGKGERRVFAGGLGAGDGVDGGIVDGVDGDVERVGVSERAAGAAV